MADQPVAGMRSGVARTATATLGVVLILIGLVFTGQGLNLIPGSFMTGIRIWFYIGVAMALVGLVLIVSGRRKPPAAR